VKHGVLRAILAGAAALVLSAAAGPLAAGATEPEPNTPIRHFMVLLQENHTFDNYFGTYPGADGIPPDVCMPVDPAAHRIQWHRRGGVAASDVNCVQPWHIGSQPIEDLDHSEATFLAQFDDGRLDGFVQAIDARNENGRQAMGYYDGQDLPFYWNLAERYTLFDRFFSSAKSGSLENHMFWVAGKAGNVADLGPGDGFDPGPPTIFDELQSAGVSWKFYVQNYSPRINYQNLAHIKDANRTSQVVWNPLLYYRRFVEDPVLSSHIVDLSQYFDDLENGSLPSVAYIVPAGSSEHPPGSIIAGQRFVRSLLNPLMQSGAWDSSAFLLAYDDWGGWYDHVSPPQVDSSGYGFRVPAILVSPYAKVGRIDSTTYDFASILRFIEENYDLPALAERDAGANSLASAFDFSHAPRAPEIVPFVRSSGGPVARSPRTILLLVYGVGMTIGAVAIALGFARRRPGQIARELAMRVKT
jgi:phospholipase C